MKPINFFFLFVIHILINACANVGAPIGGAKDIEPPKIISSNPKDQSLLFKGKIIKVAFSEYIDLKNIKSNLSITPNTQNEYEYKLNKNVLSLIFEKPFEENTTYVLDFGETIEDITERNKAQNVKLAFSTGNQIDSLYVVGKIGDMFTNVPEPNAVVGLYNVKDTIDIDNGKPLYYARTDSTGVYKITNVKRGEYKVYAIKEGKKNDLTYNSPDEKIGFLKEPLKLETKNIVDMSLVQYDIKKPVITSTRQRKQYVEVKANKKITDYEVVFADTAYTSQILHNVENDLIRFYNYSGEAKTDSITTFITIRDSVENVVKDTIKIKFDEPKEKDKDKDRDKRNTPFSFREIPNGRAGIEAGEKINLKLVFTKPVKEFLTDSISYKIDTDTVATLTERKDWQWNRTRTEITYNRAFKPKSVFSMVFRKQAFISMENDTSKQASLTYQVKKEEEYGSISGIVKTKQLSFIIQLLDENGKVEKELKNATTFKFSYVVPGKKKIRVLIDENNNGQWDRGDFSKRIPPEAIYFHPKELPVKPNWSLEDEVVDMEGKE